MKHTSRSHNLCMRCSYAQQAEQQQRLSHTCTVCWLAAQPQLCCIPSLSCAAACAALRLLPAEQWAGTTVRTQAGKGCRSRRRARAAPLGHRSTYRRRGSRGKDAASLLGSALCGAPPAARATSIRSKAIIDTHKHQHHCLLFQLLHRSVMRDTMPASKRLETALAKDSKKCISLLLSPVCDARYDLRSKAAGHRRLVAHQQPAGRRDMLQHALASASIRMWTAYPWECSTHSAV